jgi:hypothetical protein
VKLDVDLKSLIYHHGIANSDYGRWDELFEIYRNATVASEKNKLLYGLAGSREPWGLRRGGDASVSLFVSLSQLWFIIHLYSK